MLVRCAGVPLCAFTQGGDFVVVAEVVCGGGEVLFFYFLASECGVVVVAVFGRLPFGVVPEYRVVSRVSRCGRFVAGGA